MNCILLLPWLTNSATTVVSVELLMREDGKNACFSCQFIRAFVTLENLLFSLLYKTLLPKCSNESFFEAQSLCMAFVCDKRTSLSWSSFSFVCVPLCVCDLLLAGQWLVKYPLRGLATYESSFVTVAF